VTGVDGTGDLSGECVAAAAEGYLETSSASVRSPPGVLCGAFEAATEFATSSKIPLSDVRQYSRDSSRTRLPDRRAVALYNPPKDSSAGAFSELNHQTCREPRPRDSCAFPWQSFSCSGINSDIYLCSHARLVLSDYDTLLEMRPAATSTSSHTLLHHVDGLSRGYRNTKSRLRRAFRAGTIQREDAQSRVFDRPV